MKTYTKHNRNESAASNFRANLVLVLLVLGVPIATKVALQKARAASSEQVKSTESMVIPRVGHTAQLLSDGRVLISGGTDANGNPISTPEVFDPTNRTFHVPADGELDGLTTVATPGPVTDPLPPDYDIGFDLFNGSTLYFGLNGAGLYPGTNDTIVPLENSDALKRANASITEFASDKKLLIAGGVNAANQPVPAAVLFNPAKIWTDYDDYPPGTPVGIYASGFVPNETVQVQVLHTDSTLDNNSSTNHDPWQVVADANGNFTTVWNIPADEDELGATLEVTATGLGSGLVAKTTFTDAGATVTAGSATASADTAGTTTFATVSQIIIAETGNGDFNKSTSYVLTFSAPPG